MIFSRFDGFQPEPMIHANIWGQNLLEKYFHR